MMRIASLTFAALSPCLILMGLLTMTVSTAVAQIAQEEFTFYITKNDAPRFLRIFNGHTTKDEEWWAEREAVRTIQQVRCAYLRIQTERDHVHGENKQHAIDMITAATHTKFGGKGKSPWTRINGAENAPNRTYTKDNPPKWLPARAGPPLPDETLRWIQEMATKNEGQKAEGEIHTPKPETCQWSDGSLPNVVD